MTPSDRTMPIVRATWSDARKAWLVALPGGIEMAVPQAADVEPLVARHAPGTSVAFVNPNQPSPGTVRVAGASEGELRAQWGNR
jgi:hypothetical protein